MGVYQIIVLILTILRLLKKGTEESKAKLCEILDIGDGDLLRWIWENREELLEFILRIIGMIGGIGGKVGISSSGSLRKDVEELIEP